MKRNLDSDSRKVLSIVALSSLLRDILRDPIKFVGEASLASAVRSQGALASFADSARKIRACSLNTQKMHAEDSLDGGYLTLDRLRLDAKDALFKARPRVNQSTKATKIGLGLRVQELERLNQILREDLVLLQRAFDIRCKQAHYYASQSAKAAILTLCKKEQYEIQLGLSLRRFAEGRDNVISFHAE